MAGNWLALMIGNSRLHWAWLRGEMLQRTWDTPHFSAEKIQLLIQRQFNFENSDGLRSTPMPVWETLPELWLASVVAEQAQRWEMYSQVRPITLEQILLQNTYSTLGVDRALAAWGAIEVYGSPVLVIDGGTALTFTGANGQQFIGGAILPGLRLQFQMLGQETSALPVIEKMTLPDRWAMTTIEAIQSGVLHTVLSGIQSFIDDWQARFPHSVVVFTGGDGRFLQECIQRRSPKLFSQIIVDQNLWIWGLRAIRNRSS